MSPLTEVRFVAQRELAKSFRSVKGIVLLVLSLLGGTATTLLLVEVQRLKREHLPNVTPEAMHAAREATLTKAFGDPATAKSLANTPEVLLMVLVLTVWLTPLLVALLGFDTVSADLQHKGVRYWTLRTRRASYFVGKWLGLWATVSGVLLAMNAIIWVVCIVRGEASAATAFGSGFRFWLVTLPISAAWSAMATLVSSLFKTPMISLLVTFAGFFVIWVLYLVGVVTDVDALRYLYPNHFEDMLVNVRVDRVATGLAACFGMAAVYLGAGSFFFKRRDV